MERITRTRRVLGVIFLVSSIFLYPVFAEDAMLDEYIDMSLEDLLHVTVTSASGREQKQMEVSQTMTVLTREDIERSGARQLQDLFYRVPGLQVRQRDGHTYAIASRSTPKVSTNDMLVLLDGVIVFHPGSNLTIWHCVPASLDEIERIEIIRGPGGVLYSSNAVMGVINIITKAAHDTEKYVAIRGGSQSFLRTSTGFGFQPVKDVNWFIRGYYQFDTDDGFKKAGATGNLNDDIERQVFGFRTEYQLSEKSTLTASFKHNQNELVSRGFLQTTPHKENHEMTTVSTQYHNAVSEWYDFDISCWYIHAKDVARFQSDTDFDGFDIKTQHNVYGDLLGKHVFSLGAEFLINDFDFDERNYRDAEKRERNASLFFQEEYRPWESVIMTAGMRIDKHTNTPDHDASLQPYFSLMYLINKEHNLRLVASRMIRQPAYTERDLNITIGSFTTSGAANLKPEEYWTYEAGYRGMWLDSKLALNANSFITLIDDVIYFHVPTSTTTSTAVNNGKLRTYGIEVDAEYQVNTHFSVFTDYSYLGIHDNARFGSVSVENEVNGASKHSIGLGLRYTYRNLKIDMYAKYSSNSVVNGEWYETHDTEIDHFIENTMRVAYSFEIPHAHGAQAEIELVGNDLFDNRRAETDYDYFVKPQYYAGLKITF